MLSLSGTQRLYVIVVLLAIGPALIAIHPSIPFLNDSNCDPWYVFGLFYNLPDAVHWLWREVDQTALLGPSHQAARLTNVIPGYLVTKVLGGISADYVIFFTYYCSSVLLFYSIVRILMNDRVALFSTAVFAVYPLIIANYSVTYASPAIFYSIISLYLVARAIQAERRVAKLVLLFGSGAAMGAALHVHLGIVVFGVANYLIYFFFGLFYSAEKTIKPRLWHLLQAGCAVVAGLAAITLALGGIAVLFGGHFSLVFSQFQYLQYEFSGAAIERWWRQDWYLHGAIAGMFLAALLLSAINIYLCSVAARRLILPERLRQRALAVSWAILVLTIMNIVYAELGGSIVQYDYYYVFFVPYLCIVVFSPLLFLETGGARATIAWATVFLICCLSAIALNDDALGWLHLAEIEVLASLAVSICAVLLYGYLGVTGRTSRGSTPIAVLYSVLVILMLVVVRPEQMGAQIWNSPRNLQYAREYQRIRQGLTLLNNVQFKTYPEFWIDTEHGPSELIAYPRSFLSCRFQKSFPSVDADLWESGFQFLPGDDVVIISSESNIRQTAAAAFAALGLVADEVADFTLASSGEHYEFLVKHVSGTTAASSSYKWMRRQDPPADAEEVSDAFGPPLVPGSDSKPRRAFPVQITTPAEPWGYAAKFQPREENRRGPLWIRVRVDVRSGPVGIGILNRQGDDFLSRKSILAPGTVTIDLRVPYPELVGDLVVQSWEEGEPANVTIDAITVLTPRPAVDGPFGRSFTPR